MEDNGHKTKVIKNASSQMMASLLQSILGFAARKIFLMHLGENLLGLNGVMTSILGMLSLAELGVGEAINYSLYEPLAKGDTEQVKSIMNLYKKLYVGISFVIIAIGLLISPVLHLMIETSVPLSTVYVAFGAFLLDTFLSYCLAYNRNIITADQKEYIVIRITVLAQVFMSISQIVLVLLTKNYYLYLACKIVFTVVQNVYIYRKANKMYPFLKTGKVQPLSKGYIDKLVYNIKALFVIRVASFCVSGTDNILLSMFASLSSVAIFNNYGTIIAFFNNTFNAVFARTSAVIGNYIALKGTDDVYVLFKRMFFMNFLITSYTSIGILLVSGEVISVWLGQQYTWQIGIVAIIIFNNYSRFILQTCEAFRSAKGLYSPKPFVKYLAFVEGILNLVASVLLVHVLDNAVAGIFLGTTISTIISTIGVPWIVYRFLFMQPLFEFWKIYFKYLIIAFLALIISGFFCSILFTQNHLINIILGILICTFFIGITYFCAFFKTDEFGYVYSGIKNALKKGRRTI